MTKQDAVQAVQKYGSQTKAAAALGIARKTIRKALETADVGAKVAGRSLAEFRNTYDKATIVPTKVKAALKALGSGWEYEVEFAKTAGVSLADLGRFRDQFADHVVSIGRDSRRAWAGTKSTANAMKEMLS